MRIETMLQHVFLARRAGAIIRFHNRPLAPKENVAEHTYGVLVLVDLLSAGRPSVTLLQAALYHDAAEQVTGDIPHPVKKHYIGIDRSADEAERKFFNHYPTLVYKAELNEREQYILSCADMLDLLFKVYEAKLGGNNLLRDVFFTGRDHIHLLTANPPDDCEDVTEKTLALLNKLTPDFTDEHLGDVNLYGDSLVERKYL